MKKRSMKKWIPKGMYCDNCKWHSYKKNLPYQENRYCKYLNKSDYQLNEEYNKQEIKMLVNDVNAEYYDKETTIEKEFDLHFPISLLWDGCKECGIKDID